MDSILEELTSVYGTNIDELLEIEKDFEYKPDDYLKLLNDFLDYYNFSNDVSYLLDIFPIVSSGTASLYRD